MSWNPAITISGPPAPPLKTAPKPPARISSPNTAALTATPRRPQPSPEATATFNLSPTAPASSPSLKTTSVNPSLNSRAKIVAGYPAIMPSYQGQLSEEQINQLIAYIQSLAPAKKEVSP